MASFRDTIERGIVFHPTLFQEKWQVCSQLFATIGNDFEWYENGELILDYEEDKGDPWRMKELQEDIEGYKIQAKEYSSPVYAACAARGEFEKIRREFAKNNLDLILDNSCACYMFSDCNYRMNTYMKPKYFSFKYAKGFNFPDNIAKDWALGLKDFIDYWLIGLNIEYGVSADKDMEKAVAHWPDDAKELRNKLKESTQRLSKILGIDQDALDALAKKLIDDIIAEEN